MAFKYQQIAQLLEQELWRLRQEGRERLPSEVDLACQLGCSRQTIRSAQKLLMEKGLIEKRVGSGAYLKPRFAKAREVVLLAQDTAEYQYPALVRQLRRLLGREKYSLSCLDTDGSQAREREHLLSLIENPPAALLMEPLRNVLPSMNLPLLEKLHEQQVPIAYLYTSYPVPENAPCIAQDNEEGAGMLVQHLASQGHTKIAGIFRSDDARGLERYRGFGKRLLARHLPVAENAVFWYDNEDRSNMLRGNDELLRHILAQCLLEATAVICHDDELAFRLIQTAERLNISVPEQLAVVSFDNSYYAISGKVGITSLGLEENAVGETASAALRAALTGRSVKPKRLAWRLFKRQSG